MDQPNDDLTALLSATGIGAQACAASAAELLRLMDNDPKNLTKPDTIAACHAFAQSICEQMATMNAFAEAAGRFRAWADSISAADTRYLN